MSGAWLLTGGAVLDGTDPTPRAAVAVVDDRVVAVGTDEAARAALPSDHRTVDLAGRTVVPGFVDAHLHPLPMCFFEHHLDLAGATSLPEVLDALADRARTTDDPWVLGLRLDDEQLDERRLPTRDELDRVGGGRPVVLLRRDGHHAVGSSAALEATGLAATTEDPPGGVVHRDADGRPTGLCGEAAASLLLSGVPLPEWEAFESATDRVVARLASQGITAVSGICQTGDVGPSGAAGAMEADAWSALLDRVPFDVQTILVTADPADLLVRRDGPLHRPAAGRRLDAVKVFLDGTLGGHTACMHHPFADRDVTGMLTTPEQDAYATMAAAHLAGLQVCVHAIGDRANRVAVDLFDRLLAEHPDPDHRHRVEHASVLDEATVDDFARLGLTAVVQPVSIGSERAWLAKRLGPDRIGRVYPFRSLLDAGADVAGSSDAPIESTDVLGAMRCATDRRGVAAGQAIAPAEALAMYTSGAAWARRSEGVCGTLVPGRRADLAVLSHDPISALDRAEVVATVVAGEVVFGAAALAGAREGGQR